jgi:hypothetical protein
MRLARILLAAPVVGTLVVTSVYALKRGASDSLAYDASIEMGTWVAARSQPGEATWNWVRADLDRAVAIRNDPVTQELLGVLLAMRRERPDVAALAGDHFIAALRARPTSGYTWASLAEVFYQQGNTGTAFEVALRRAAEFGPAEPAVQRTVANLGLAVYDEVTPVSRTAIEHMVAAGMRRNPREMLQISERRGRLDVACRQAQGIESAAHRQWLQLCPGREPTS